MFDRDLFDDICGRIAEGRSLRAICREDEDAPGLSTFMRWLADYPEIREQYARARDAQADVFFDECADIADSAKTAEDVQVARLRIDTRKWMAGKMRPKVYGDKLDMNLSGGLTVNVVDSFDPE